MSTTIEWTQETWNPVTGCTKVSEGCRHCYAATFAGRQMGAWKGREFSDVRCHPERLGIPGHWRRPRRVFVNSMSDLFHPAVPYQFIDRVFATKATLPRHTFQVLTKRPERMRDYMIRRFTEGSPERMTTKSGIPMIPPSNVWLGVSCEDQATADERIPLLLQTPAAVRFVSCEPLLGPVSFRWAKWDDHKPNPRRATQMPEARDGLAGCVSHLDGLRMLDWIIVGGESGPKARPCDVAWIRSIVEESREAVVPCFMKQLGANPRLLKSEQVTGFVSALAHVGAFLRDRKGGDPAEWPKDLRVREMPETGR